MTPLRFTLAAVFLAETLAAAQTAPAPDSSNPTAPQPQAAASAPAPAPAAATSPNIILVPAGTKVLLELRSSVNTKSAHPGDGVYLSSTFPVVVGNRVVIPSGVYVQGVVDAVVRPGRGVGAKHAQLNMHFTSMIFPNGSVVEIPGVVNALPGAEHQKVNGDEGTIEQDGGSNKAHNAGETAKVAVPTGATIGSIGGLQDPAILSRAALKARAQALPRPALSPSLPAAPTSISPPAPRLKWFSSVRSRCRKPTSTGQPASFPLPPSNSPCPNQPASPSSAPPGSLGCS